MRAGANKKAAAKKMKRNPKIQTQCKKLLLDPKGENLLFLCILIMGL